MKKLISILLLLALLCGCGASGAESEFIRISSIDGSREIVPPRFEELEYVRPGSEALEEKITAVREALDSGKGLRTVTALLDDCYREYYDYYTMMVLADILASRDYTDEGLAEENEWCENLFYTMQELMDEMYHICGASSMADKLEKSYFWDGFAEEYAEDDGEALYSEKLLRLYEDESALLTRYYSLMASPEIEIDGMTVNYNDYAMTASDEDYDRAMEAFYDKYNPLVSEIYIELVKLRHEIAAELGYDSYKQMQYLYYFERDYTEEDAEKYIEDIKEYIVPLYRRVMETEPYDNVSYDWLSEQRLLEIIGEGAANMGGEVQQAFEFMTGLGYYDCAVDDRKVPMSFQSYLTSCEAPFLFMDAYGDMEDILTFSHEFGHYTNAFVSYDMYGSIDNSECFSQTMEYLMLENIQSALSAAERENLYLMKMLDTIELYVQQASFAEFENRVYAAEPERLDADFLNELSLQLAEEYAYSEGMNEKVLAMSWIDIPHYFEMPFYTVSYPVSNDAAMQIYELERSGAGSGVEKYSELLSVSDGTLLYSLEAAGLESPFAAGRIERVAKLLEEALLS